ncbi:MAG: hypothetical protein ACKV2O_21675 [Acidimicrobiales bacterium]
MTARGAHFVDAAWDRVAGRVGAGPVRRDVLLATFLILTPALNGARSTLDQGIRKIHPAGADGVSVNSLHNGADSIRKAFDTWERGHALLGTSLSRTPISLAILQTVLELALVFPSFVLLHSAGLALRRRVQKQSVRTVLDVAALGVVAYAALGILNQIAELVVLLGQTSAAPLAFGLRIAGPLRSIMLLLVLVPLALGAVELGRSRWAGAAENGTAPEDGYGRRAERVRSTAGRWLATPTSYRVLLLVVGLHATLFLVGIPASQTADALRLWSQRPTLLAWSLLGTAMLSTALATMALRIGTHANPCRAVLGLYETVLLLAGSLTLIALGLLTGWGPVGGHPWHAFLLAAGLLGFAVAALSLPHTAPGRPSPRPLQAPSHRATNWLPGLLALAPPVVLTVALTRALVPSYLDARPVGWLIVGVVLVGMFGVSAFAVVGWIARDLTPSWSRALFRTLIGLLIASSMVTALAVLANPWRIGGQLGVTALFSIFLTLLVGFFGTVGFTTEKRALPAALDLVGFRRMPIVTGLMVLGVLSSILAPDGYHDLRTIKGETLPPMPQITAEAALKSWTAAQLSTATTVARAPAVQPATPLVFVTAAGGGLKAAAFTAATLDCIFNPMNLQRTGPAAERCASDELWPGLFVVSGASGGSVGIASVLAERARSEPSDNWVADRLGRDLLSAELSWQLFAEMGNAVLHIDPSKDRGEVLEESWRRAFGTDTADPGGTAFFTDRSTGEWAGPLAFFSGTDVGDGCRVNIGAVRSAQPRSDGASLLEPGASRRGACQSQRFAGDVGAVDQAGTRDLVDYLCGKNIDLATAAFLSARFPIVSPVATARCADDDEFTDDSLTIGDGGYRDNSGAASVSDMWAVLEPIVASYNATHDQCIAPILIEINNGYDGYGAPTAEADVAQLSAPLLGATKVFGDLSFGPIEQTAAEFDRPLSPGVTLHRGATEIPSRFFRVSLSDHPGVTAPLGWSLSRSAVEDLVSQLGRSANHATLQHIQSLLEPSPDEPLTCHRSESGAASGRG